MKRRKIISLLLILAMLMSFIPAFAINAFAEAVTSSSHAPKKNQGQNAKVDTWDGTSDTSWYTGNQNEYTLTTAEQLAGLASLVNGGYTFAGITVKLGADLDLDGYNWTPIGFASGESRPFKGVFDGGYHTVKNVSITHTQNYDSSYSVGLFGTLSGATVKNVGVLNCNYNLIGGRCGALCGALLDSSKVENCFATGNLVFYRLESYFGVGGLVGDMRYGASVNNSYADCTIEASVGSPGFVGGLVGFSCGEGNKYISNCYSTSTVTTYAGSTPGGLVGYQYYDRLDITSCFSDALVNGAYSNMLVGSKNAILSYSNCYYRAEGSDSFGGYTTDASSFADASWLSSTLGWDMESVWTVENGASYPTLRGFANVQNGGNNDDNEDDNDGNNERVWDEWNGGTDTSWYNGQQYEYTLTTAEQLAGLASLVNSGYTFEGVTVKLGASLDLAGYEWMPIGHCASFTEKASDYNYAFKGVFDGQGNQIKNLKISEHNYESVGLFGATCTAEVKNLELTDISITTQQSMCVGGLVSMMYATVISNVAVSGNIDVYEDNNVLMAGMVAGHVTVGTNAVTGVTVTGNVTGDAISTAYVGGIVAVKNYSSGSLTITDAVVNGNVTGSDYAAGVIGIAVGGTAINNVIVMGSLYSKSYIDAVAYQWSNYYPTTSNAFYSATLTVNGSSASTYLGSYADESNFADAEWVSAKLGWDLENVWALENGASHPTLRCFANVQNGGNNNENDDEDDNIPENLNKNVLLIENRKAWGFDTNSDVLQKLVDEGKIASYVKVSTDYVTSGQTNLSDYGLVLLAGEQGSAFYSGTLIDLLEEYVENGGSIFIGYPSDNSNAIPFGITFNKTDEGQNYIVDTEHPFITENNFTNADMVGNSINHAYFTSYPENTNVILKNASGYPTLFEFEAGEGFVCVSALTFEHGQQYPDLFPFSMGYETILLNTLYQSGNFSEGDDEDVKCENHVDENGDLKCDNCGEALEDDDNDDEDEPVIINKKVLLVESKYPWGNYSNTELLTQLLDSGSIESYDRVSSSDVVNGYVNLADYGLVLVAGYQDSSFYSVSLATALENYAKAGGSVFLGMPQHAQSGTLPFGIYQYGTSSQQNYIVDANHPFVTGEYSDNVPMTNTDMVGSAINHIYLSEYPDNANVILKDGSNNPTLIDFAYGEGFVTVSCLTFEYAWKSQGGFPFYRGYDDVVLNTLYQNNNLSGGNEDDDNDDYEIVIDSWDGSKDTAWYNGQKYEYTITTAEQLAGLASLVNSGYSFSGITIKLGANLDLAGYEWTPIGFTSNESCPFGGIFDGGYHTIYNVTITHTQNYGSGYGVGLFGTISGATIKNLAVVDCNYTLNGGRCGALCGIMDYNSKVENCYSTGNLEFYYLNECTGVGGLIGDMREGTTLENSFADCTVEATVGADGFVGGLVGFACGDGNKYISNCYSMSTVTTHSGNTPGGLVGFHYYGALYITSSFSDGIVNGSYSNMILGTKGDRSGTLQYSGCYYRIGASDRFGGSSTDVSSFADNSWIAYNLGWDMENDWIIEKGAEYPTLRHFAENREPAEPHEHEFVESSRREATCENAGMIVYTCSCGDERFEVIEALRHNIVTEIRQEASCENDGIIVDYCTRCDYYKETVIHVSHNFVEIENVKPTCEVAGYIKYGCTNCDEEYTIEVTSSHNYVESERVEAQVGVEGKIVYTCTNCDDSYEIVLPELMPVEKNSSVLLIQDNRPWSQDVNVSLLNTLMSRGTVSSYNVITSRALDTFDLTQYGVVFIANDQSQATYDNLATYAEKLENYVRAGGVLIYGACDKGWGGGTLSATLPGGVESGNYYSVHNYVVDSLHPVVTGVNTDNRNLENELLKGNYCSHAYFEADSLPEGTNIIIRDANGNATLIEYTLGEGTVLASGLTWEYFYVNTHYDMATNYSKYAFDDLLTYAIYMSGAAEGCKHTFAISEVIEPTCQTKGYTLYVCENCGHQYKDNVTDEVDHSFTEYTYNNDATCQANGTKTAYCDYGCGEYHTTEAENTKTAHSESSWIVTLEPTCTENGSQHIVCLDCGLELYVDTVYARGYHNYSSWYVGKEANCFEEGYYEQYCYDCGHKQYETIDKTEHNWELMEEIPSYIIVDKHQETYQCTICSSTMIILPPPLLEDGTPKIVLTSKNVMVDSTFEVEVSLVNNPGISAFNLDIIYDMDVLTLTDVVVNSDIGGMFNYSESAVWANGANLTEDCVVMTLVFSVNEGMASIGDTTKVSVEYGAGDVTNYDEEDVYFYVEEGEITFADYIAGDINFDGLVNTTDLTRLIKYLSGEDVVVNELALDVNGDSEVNIKDYVRLLKYISGEDVEIY